MAVFVELEFRDAFNSKCECDFVTMFNIYNIMDFVSTLFDLLVCWYIYVHKRLKVPVVVCTELAELYFPSITDLQLLWMNPQVYSQTHKDVYLMFAIEDLSLWRIFSLVSQ